jgi:CheY-like chemotaxis protein
MTMVASTAEGSKRRVAAPILVVDDEPDILDVVVMMLEVEGYETKTARDGTEALTAIERERPSLVLLDMRMPRMDGWEFARTLAERGLDIPVVVMTAARDARRWADEIDADAYLGKPFQMDALIRTIRRVLERDG